MRTALMVLLTLTISLNSIARGQSIDSDALEFQVQQLRAELADLRSRVDGSGGVLTAGFESETCTTGVVGCGETGGPCSPVIRIGSGQSKWTLGFEFVFARPRLLESFDTIVADFATNTQTLVPLDYDYDLAPRISLGYSGTNGTGVRARYWSYDGESAPTSLVAGPTTRAAATVLTVIFPATLRTPVPGDVLNVSNSLETRTLDLEGTYDVRLGETRLVSSIGLRYAELDQRKQANVVSGGAVVQSLDWTRRFHGLGIVTGVDARRPFKDTGLAFVFRSRAALLHSDKSVHRSVIGDVTPPANATLPIIALDDTKESSAVGEVGLGLEYSRQLERANVFARGMYEGQIWTGIGTPALGFLGFEGFSAGFGIEY